MSNLESARNDMETGSSHWNIKVFCVPLNIYYFARYDRYTMKLLCQDLTFVKYSQQIEMLSKKVHLELNINHIRASGLKSRIYVSSNYKF